MALKIGAGQFSSLVLGLSRSPKPEKFLEKQAKP
jgi:hypothetical protein